MISLDMTSTQNVKQVFIPGWNIKADIFKPYAAPESILFTPPLATTDTPYEEAIASLRAQNLERQHILGWSMGGQIALAFTARYPEKVASLTLLSSAAIFSRNEADKRSFMTLCQNDFPRTIKYFHKLMGALSIERSLQLKSNFINDKISALRYLHELHTRDLTTEAKTIKCPVTIVHSQDDRIIPVSEAYYLKECLPQARLEILTSDQHFPLFTKRDKMPPLL